MPGRSALTLTTPLLSKLHARDALTLVRFTGCLDTPHRIGFWQAGQGMYTFAAVRIQAAVLEVIQG